ncbi:MAG: hypothetical protein LBR15_03900 [Methanobrevibacter sp.]|jgi:hypothetical protein|nr:hypothetical protein [Candidatus Methanovirga australis]
MNAKVVLSLVTLGIFMTSSLGNVSASEIGLWMSAKNSPGNHGTFNDVYIRNAHGYGVIGGKKVEIQLHYDWHQSIYSYNKRGVYLTYTAPTTITKVVLDFQLVRATKGHDGFSRAINFNMTFPVDGNWICGISKNAGGTGMYFVADNHYPKLYEDKMDTVHCFFNDREAWKAPGGKFHYPETFTVEFPNGQVWN